MEKIGSVFKDYRIILYYDNSSDNTLDILKEYNGINDYILDLKKDYLKGKLTITRNQSIYVIRHHQVQPKIVKKVYKAVPPNKCLFIEE